MPQSFAIGRIRYLKRKHALEEQRKRRWNHGLICLGASGAMRCWRNGKNRRGRTATIYVRGIHCRTGYRSAGNGVAAICRESRLEVSPTLIPNVTEAVIEVVKLGQGGRWKSCTPSCIWTH